MSKRNVEQHGTTGSSARSSRRPQVVLLVVGLVFAVIGVGMLVRRSDQVPAGDALARPLAEPWFVNVAPECGINFHHDSGGHPAGEARLAVGQRSASSKGDGTKLYFPEIMAGGVCLLDYDRDGFLDVYFVQGGDIRGVREDTPGNVLYHNRRDGRFEDVTARAGVGDRGYGMGCTCADFDGDGWTDIYVTNVGANSLWRNNQDGTFTEIGASAGVDDESFASSAAFLDYDRDGDLDLFIANYIVWSVESELDCWTPANRPDYCGPLNYKSPAADRLYRNEGNGTFTDVSDLAGISASVGNGLGVVVGDFNDDGWDDLYVANDKSPNHLWINQKDGTFRNEALTRGLAYNSQGLAEAGMGVAAADLEQDGDLDLLVTNFADETNTLYVGSGGFFEDRTSQKDLSASRPFTGFGTALIDFDNDGDLDVYVANGRVVVGHASYQKLDRYAEPNQLFEGTDDGTFREVKPQGAAAGRTVHTSRGAAFGDYDNDGDLDIFVVNRDAQAYVLRNRAGQGQHWIAFRVLNRVGADALGARVRIDVNNQTHVGSVRPAYSYCASNDPRIYFGLAKATRVTGVSVTWPDGSNQGFGSFEADQIVELARGDQPGR